VTKGVQEIHLDKHIRLLDSPGIVFTSGEGAAAAALRNAIKVRHSAVLCSGVATALQQTATDSSCSSLCLLVGCLELAGFVA
jgi:nuclear GTP-binding protein